MKFSYYAIKQKAFWGFGVLGFCLENLVVALPAAFCAPHGAERNVQNCTICLLLDNDSRPAQHEFEPGWRMDHQHTSSTED